jgi:Mn2+/Fe2+ NRAMP family transporter
MTWPKYGDDLLDVTGKGLPTDVGLRRLEEEARADIGTSAQETGKRHGTFQALGPGFLSGMAGNDTSAVASYSLDGAQSGYGHLWRMLLSTPLLQAVQFACAKIGRVQQKGLAEILREQYGRKVAIPAALLLIVTNIVLIAADLVAISTGLESCSGQMCYKAYCLRSWSYCLW